MIIGHFYEDGTYPEPVDLSNKRRYFELEVCMVRHPRRYPKYRVDYASIAFCDTFEAAEALMKEIVRTERYNMDDVYCFYIYERAMDVLFDRSEYTKCWLFDAKGEMTDKRLFPSYWSEKEFDGRSEDEIRFKWGDLVEYYDGDYVRLYFVLAPPTGKEHYMTRDYKGDVSDDSYIIIDGPGYQWHEHIDALHLFKPHYPIPKNIMRKYEKMWEGYLKERDEYNKENHFNSPI